MDDRLSNEHFFRVGAEGVGSNSIVPLPKWYGWLLMILRRNNEGIRELKKAAALDPLSLIISADLADAYSIDHDFTSSIVQSRRTIEMDPRFAMAHLQLGQALIGTRQYDSAIQELRQAIVLSQRNPICTSYLGYVYALTGRKAEASKILIDLQNIALIYTSLNERDRPSFGWTELTKTALIRRFRYGKHLIRCPPTLVFKACCGGSLFPNGLVG